VVEILSAGKHKCLLLTFHTGTEKEKRIAFLILNLDARWGRVGNATPRPPYPREKFPVPTVKEAVWALGSVCTGVEKRKYLQLKAEITRRRPILSAFALIYFSA
jgi:hypothetical protein